MFRIISPPPGLHLHPTKKEVIFGIILFTVYPFIEPLHSLLMYFIFKYILSPPLKSSRQSRVSSIPRHQTSATVARVALTP